MTIQDSETKPSDGNISQQKFARIKALKPYLSHFGDWETDISIRVMFTDVDKETAQLYATGYILTRQEANFWIKSYCADEENDQFQPYCGQLRNCVDCPDFVLVANADLLPVEHHECQKQLDRTWDDDMVIDLLLSKKITSITTGQYGINEYGTVPTLEIVME